MSNGENLIHTNGVDLCVETFGDPTDPTILLVHGACASMLWWETELCQQIAGHGRHVIRYDNRDTGRSTSYPAGQPGYSLTDLTNDAIGILDVLGIDRAHLVGRSMSGAVALTAGVDHADRVASLTFVATTTGDDDLPPMSEAFLAVVAENPDPTDTAAVVDFVVATLRAYSGPSSYFDPAATRALAEQDVARAHDIAATLVNHFLIDVSGPVNGGFGDITAPTLVVQGEFDPVYPLPHGEALRDAIPGAELLVLERAGHEVPQALWDVFSSALIRHTAG